MKELRKNDDVDFGELKHMVGIASSLRCIMKDHNQTIEDAARELDLPMDDIKNILTAGYSGDLRLIAKIDAYWHRLEIKEIQEKSIAVIPKSE